MELVPEGRPQRVMRALEEAFRRDRALASKLKEIIQSYAERLRAIGVNKLVIMNFCGTHEWTVTNYGIRALMPSGIELVAGPGCPVCVTPSLYIEHAIRLSLDGLDIYTYGDVYRLRTVKPVRGVSSLQEVRAAGGSVRVVSSLVDAIRIAKERGRDSVFLGVGFETVAPGYAVAFRRSLIPSNMRFMSIVKLTPPAMRKTLEEHMRKGAEYRLGVIAPGHVSSVIGGRAWLFVSEEFKVPTVVAGFEPIDVLIAIAEILRQTLRGESRTIVEYSRVVRWEGNIEAQGSIAEVFEVVDDVWRGIGPIAKSGLSLPDGPYSPYDAFRVYGLRRPTETAMTYDLPPGCKCSQVIIGMARPTDCPLFMKACTPEKPYGPCMVSMEGTCSVWARCGEHVLARLRSLQETAEVG